MTSCLCVENLNYTYPDGTQALIDINIRINDGEKVALIGANGSGKSTLQFHLNGLLQAQSGKVWVNQSAVIPANFTRIRAWIGLVFQNPDDQLFMPTVEEDIAFGPKNLGVKGAILNRLVRDSLEAVNLDPDHYLHRNPEHLSGGEKKRVAIAGVLAMQPQILVLDEPSAQLDPRSRRQLIELLAQLPVTQLIATHDLDLALELCDRSLVLSRGHLVYDGSIWPLMADHAFLAHHALESPLSFARPYCNLKDHPLSFV